MKQVSTMLGDAEYEQFNLALSRTNKTTYEFVKHAVLREVDRALANEKGPIVEQMAQAVADRKWGIYQMQDFSDRNHLAWLATRFPKTSDHDRREAISQFRVQQMAKKVSE